MANFTPNVNLEFTNDDRMSTVLYNTESRKILAIPRIILQDISEIFHEDLESKNEVDLCDYIDDDDQLIFLKIVKTYISHNYFQVNNVAELVCIVLVLSILKCSKFNNSIATAVENLFPLTYFDDSNYSDQFLRNKFESINFDLIGALLENREPPTALPSWVWIYGDFKDYEKLEGYTIVDNSDNELCLSIIKRHREYKIKIRTNLLYSLFLNIFNFEIWKNYLVESEVLKLLNGGYSCYPKEVFNFIHYARETFTENTTIIGLMICNIYPGAKPVGVLQTLNEDILIVIAKNKGFDWDMKASKYLLSIHSKALDYYVAYA